MNRHAPSHSRTAGDEGGRRGLGARTDQAADHGGLGMDMGEFEKQSAMFEEMFAFAFEPDRAKIRSLNVMRLFTF